MSCTCRARTWTGPERVRLFEPAFDASISGVSGRQSLYEYFFFGDPGPDGRRPVANSYDREPRSGPESASCCNRAD